jgi:hypothetical protein
VSGLPFAVEAAGCGRVELPAYGLADAEHRVEKELRELWPDARVRVLEIGSPASGRIVEEYAVRYSVRGRREVAAASREEADREVLRELRARFGASRYDRIAWEIVREPEGRSAR